MLKDWVPWETMWMCSVAGSVLSTIRWDNWCIIMLNYTLIVMCLWQRDVGSCMSRQVAMKSWIWLRLSFPWEPLVLSHGVSLVLLVIWAWFVVFFMFGARPCHFVVVSYRYGFSRSSSWFFLVFSFIVLSLGNWLGKRKVNGARWELCGTQEEM